MIAGTVRALWLTLSVCLCVVACNKEAPAPVDSTRGARSDTSKEKSTGTGVSEDEPGYVLQDHERGAGLAEACHQDQECLQPLRCLELKCVVPPAVLGGESKFALGRMTLNVDGNAIDVNIEVADTSFERQRGLMYRTEMGENWGMLFVFEEAEPRSFWMRNTYLPLDMFFIADDGEIVAIAENARPLDVGPRYASGGHAARYVLELNAGYAGRNNIRVGQKVKLMNVPGPHDAAILGN